MYSDAISLSGLNIVHLNAHSLLSKMDIIRIWVKSTDVDIVTTRLTKSVIYIDGYNVYRADRPKKGGSVAMGNQNFMSGQFCLHQSASNWKFWH